MFAGQKGFPTPSDVPSDTGCRTFQIPDSQEWFSLVMGALNELRSGWNWYQTEGGMDVWDAASAAAEILDNAYALSETGQCQPDVGTPYWDDESDVEGDQPAEMQPWYGFVTDIFAPPDGITWNENISLWLFTGLVAIAATPAAAIVFRPLAVQFTIAFKAGDVGETIRIILDAIEQRPVDTTGHAGEIMTVACSGDPSLSEHTLYVIKTS